MRAKPTHARSMRIPSVREILLRARSAQTDYTRDDHSSVETWRFSATIAPHPNRQSSRRPRVLFSGARDLARTTTQLRLGFLVAQRFSAAINPFVFFMRFSA